jgi:preprotein translocase subunit SecG
MLLYYAIVAMHVLVCVILILVVLLQSGKGADLAGAFGGGATQTAFGSRGPASFLSKVTTGAAILFMMTSIALSGISTGSSKKSIMEGAKQTTVPASKAPAPASQVKVPTPEEIKKQQQEIEAKQKQAPAKTPEQPATPAGQQAPAAGKKAPGKNA